MARPLRYVPQLDGLRAVAIALVMLHHLPAAIGRDLGPLQPLSAAGWFGVDVFFALSGFLITSILLRTVNRPDYWRSFYVRRALRILPLYYSLLTLIFVVRALAPAIPADMRPSPLWFYGFLSNFWFAQKPASTDLALEVTWSLSVEEQFYLVWPLAIRCLPRRALRTGLIALIAAAPVYRLLLAENAQTLGYTLCRIDGLAIGCLAALWWFSGSAHAPRYLGEVATALWAVLFFVVWRGGFQLDRWGVPVFTYALVPTAAAATILAVLWGQGRVLADVLGWRPLVWIGRISFGLYLLHPLAFNVVHQLSRVCGPWLSGPRWGMALLWAGLAVSLSLAIAAASYQLFERRFLAWKDRLAPVVAAPSRADRAVEAQHA